MRKVKRNTKKTNSASRALHYFWLALMQSKLRLLFVMLIIPIYCFLGSAVMPKCISEIIALLTTDEEIVTLGSTGLTFTLKTIVAIHIASTMTRMILIRVIDWNDWSLDAIGGQYLSKISFDKIVNESMSFHSKHFSGSLTSQASKLSSAYINFKSCIIWSILPLIYNVIFAITTAFFVSPVVALILIIFSTVYCIVATIAYSKTRKYDEKLPSAENKLVGKLSDAITNILNIKSYAHEDIEKRRFAHATQGVYDATISTAKISVVRYGTLGFISTSLEIAIIFALIYARKSLGISAADIVLLYSVTSSIMSRVWEINSILRAMNRAFSDAKEMVEILDTPTAIEDTNSTDLVVKNAEIDFHDITFKHDDSDKNLFEDFNLKIAAGERIGLVGISGSGKTSLTKLLLRFSDINSGKILIDGQDISQVTQKSLRQNIAYVPQETLLFHRSIEENIAYGKDGATKAEIEHAAHLSSADTFIKNLPEGYKTEAGERGCKLSGGQRQRIAIARAFLKDAPILILDEATAALDSESETIIQKASERLMKNRTSIVIAHRLSTIASLDRIIVLKDGKIIEQGSHRQLLLQNGAYKKLWSHQTGSFLESNDEES